MQPQRSAPNRSQPPEDDRARDRELVDRVLDGDPMAFSEIYDSYFPRVYAFTLKRVGDPAEAEDLTQEIFHLRYGESHSIKAIAEKVGKSNEAVKVSLRRSRAVLAGNVPEFAVVLENVAQSA